MAQQGLNGADVGPLVRGVLGHAVAEEVRVQTSDPAAFAGSSHYHVPSPIRKGGSSIGDPQLAATGVPRPSYEVFAHEAMGFRAQASAPLDISLFVDFEFARDAVVGLECQRPDG